MNVHLHLEFGSANTMKAKPRPQEISSRKTAPFFALLGMAALCLMLAAGRPGSAGTPVPEAGREPLQATDLPNLRAPTLGGRQLWADRAYQGGWRVQCHVWTGHCRLLDPSDRRQAWGDFQSVMADFSARRKAGQIRANRPHLVVLLHGLGRSRQMFAELARTLEASGYEAAALAYPSTRRPLADQADELAALLGRLEGVQRVSFVTHSLGGMVLRRLLAEERAYQRTIAPGRAVLIAPPSQGARLADLLRDVPAYRALSGPAGQEITTAAAASLPSPNIPFGIIAGVRGDGAGYNPLLPGEDDGVVSLAEVRLNGAADFLTVEELHTFIALHHDTLRAVPAFLATGRF